MEISAAYTDRSRDRRIEDPTNLWVIHRASRALLPLAVRHGISANSVSVIGLAVGASAAICFWNWQDPRLATLGFLLSIGWLIMDGLDGMVARATGTAGALGRFLDGLCDHGTFALIYFALAGSINTAEGWILAFAAAFIHGLQANTYEGERARYHRRLRGDPVPPSPTRTNALVHAYDRLATSLDRVAAPFDRALADAADKGRLIERYQRFAIPPMKLEALLTANVRIMAIYAACLAGDPKLFWWFEIVVLSAVALAGILWHRRAERLSLRSDGP